MSDYITPSDPAIFTDISEEVRNFLQILYHNELLRLNRHANDDKESRMVTQQDLIDQGLISEEDMT